MSQKKIVYPLDELYKGSGDVYTDADIGYCCTLNQTDIDANKNKFYIMQIIKISNNSFKLFIRYGRIGEPGKVLSSDFVDADSAIYDFKKQFKTTKKIINF